MVARVLLESNAFKVSKPGFNVLTATHDQLLISYQHRPARVVIRGHMSTLASNTTVNFGQTLAALPIVIWQSGNLNWATGVTHIPYWYAGAAVLYVDCYRYTDRVQFRPNSAMRDFYYIVAEAV